MDLTKKLTPVFKEDSNEWKELIAELKRGAPPLFWYAGAAFDKTPLVGLYNHLYPEEVQKILSPDIFPVFTDYSSKIVEALKYIYENLDKTNFAANKLPNDYWFASQLSGVGIFQMIPLTLFGPDDLIRIRLKYQGFHSGVTFSVIPDDKWHFVYIGLEIEEREYRLIYGLLENLAFWKEVVEKYNLEIEVFCALRVGSKSGSWDKTHSPKVGSLFNAIRRSSSTDKPKIWVADDCQELRKIWREIEPHDKGFYGQMHFFKAIWGDI